MYIKCEQLTAAKQINFLFYHITEKFLGIMWYIRCLEGNMHLLSQIIYSCKTL